MCGIVVVLPAYSGAESGAAPRSVRELAALLPIVPAGNLAADGLPDIESLQRVAGALAFAADQFRTPAVVRLVGNSANDRTTVRDGLARLTEWAGRVEDALDAARPGLGTSAAENMQAVLRRIRDQLWTVDHDGIRLAEAAWSLGPGAWTDRSSISYSAIATSLDVIDRLEVRGRDSAGLSVWVELDRADRTALSVCDREDDLFRSGSVILTATGLCFVYKRAAIIGSLGDNTAAHPRRDPRRSVAALGARPPVGPRDSPRAHPLGERRADLGGECPSRGQRRSGWRRTQWACLHRRPQRRRRQLPRPLRADGLCTRPGRGDHRCQADPAPGVRRPGAWADRAAGGGGHARDVLGFDGHRDADRGLALVTSTWL